MSNQYFNFYYDPVRQGYDSNTWSTISGAPSVVSNKLTLLHASTVHFADILRGELTISVNIPAPTAGDSVQFGFSDPNQGDMVTFVVVDNVLSAKVVNGALSSLDTITWDTSWSSTNTEFKIKWEAGKANFYIGGVNKSSFGYDYISGNPLNVYLASDSTSPLKVNYIDVKGIQNLIWS